MTSEQFDQLVNRLQSKYGSRPFALRCRLAALVALGYAGFLAILLLVLLLSVGLMTIAFLTGKEPGVFLIAVVAILLAFGICQALVFLWVPIESEPAREVVRGDAPRLFELLDQIQSRLGVAAFHHVRITSEFNSYVQMIPRLGVFGFNRNSLYLGLPMMRALTIDNYAAVLAHEFAHYSSRHDRFGMWIYRLRRTWNRVFAELQDSNTSGLVHNLRRPILWFVDWYWPRFNAHAFVLSRANEYEADRLAAEVTGVDCAAEALFRIECAGLRFNEKFWVGLAQQARASVEVPNDVLQRMQIFLGSDPEPGDANRWLDLASQTLTGNIDTHPSLADRLKALDSDVQRLARTGFPRIPSQSAAETLLGDALPEIEEDVNRQWQKENSLRWQNIYNQGQRLEKELNSIPGSASRAADSEDLESTVEAESQFDVDQAWQRARTVLELQGPHVAEPLLRELLDHHPNHALANVTLGRHLLEQGQSEGEHFVRRVIDNDDSDLMNWAYDALIRYFRQQGQVDRLRETQMEFGRFEAAQAAAMKERSLVTAADTFVPHGLQDDELSALTAILSRRSDLDSAWLARKQLRHFRNQRLYVLVVRTSLKGFLRSSTPEHDRVLVAALVKSVKLAGRILIIAPQGGFRNLARKIMSLPHSRVFAAGPGEQQD